MTFMDTVQHVQYKAKILEQAKKELASQFSEKNVLFDQFTAFLQVAYDAILKVDPLPTQTLLELLLQ